MDNVTIVIAKAQFPKTIHNTHCLKSKGSLFLKISIGGIYNILNWNAFKSTLICLLFLVYLYNLPQSVTLSRLTDFPKSTPQWDPEHQTY